MNIIDKSGMPKNKRNISMLKIQDENTDIFERKINQRWMEYIGLNFSDETDKPVIQRKIEGTEI